MQELLDSLHNDLVVKVLPAAGYLPVQLVYVGGLLVAAALIVVWMSLIAMAWTLLERKVSADIQNRIGPNRAAIHIDNQLLLVTAFGLAVAAAVLSAVGAGIVAGPGRGLLAAVIAGPLVGALVWGVGRALDYFPKGWIVSLCDGLKLLTKEDIVPNRANRFLYELAPLLVFAGAFIPFVALPFSQHLIIADMDLALFYVVAFGSLEVVGILMAGWAPNSKWSLYGGMRLAAQMLSYEIPLGLSLMTVVIMAGSLNLREIVEYQTAGVPYLLQWLPGLNETTNTWWIFDFLNWAIFRSPAAFVAFVIFYVAGLAETKRAPFDLPEAESELVSGFHTEYTGMRFAYFFLAEYCAMYVISALGAAVFLGGWHWPLPTPHAEGVNFIGLVLAKLGDVSYADLGAFGSVKQFLRLAFWDGPIATIQSLGDARVLKFLGSEAAGFLNMQMKAFFLMFVMLWVRWTLPRVRIDQVMHVCLKVLLPFSLVCVVWAAAEVSIVGPRPEAAAAAALEAAAPEAEAIEPAQVESDATTESEEAVATAAPTPAPAEDAAPATTPADAASETTPPAENP